MRWREAIILSMALILIGAGAYTYSSQKTLSLREANGEIYRNSSYIFTCPPPTMSDTGACELFVSNLKGEGLRDLNIRVDDPKEAVLISPTGKYILVTEATSAIVIDTGTAMQREIFHAPQGLELGTWYPTPSFLPHARWSSANSIELSLFAENTPEPMSYINEKGEDIQPPSAVPVQKKTITVN